MRVNLHRLFRLYSFRLLFFRLYFFRLLFFRLSPHLPAFSTRFLPLRLAT